MKTPDMPLIQSALTKAVRSETSGASAARASSGSSSSSGVEFSATVTASRRTPDAPPSGQQTGAEVARSEKNNASPNNWQITVTSQGKSLNLQSSHPLPVGAEVSLRVTEQTPPSVVITDINLAQSQASANPASQASRNASLASQLQSMAQQLQLTAALQLARASNGITTSSTILQQNPASSSGAGPTTSPTAALPDAIKALLMARAGWSQGSPLQPGLVAASSAGATSSSQSSGLSSSQAAPATNGYSVGGSAALRGPSVATTSTPDYSAVLRAVLNDLTSAGANRNSPSSLLPPTEALVRNLPDAAQLSSPSGLHKVISNSPLNYESQLFRLAATPHGSSATSGESTSSPTTVASVFKTLWSKAAAHAGAPASSTASSAASGASESLRQSVNTDTSAIAKPSLLSAIETLQKQLSSDGPDNAETSAAQLAALLSNSPASSTASSVLQSSPIIPGDNLKGLLLFILGRSQSNSASEGATGSAAMAAARSGAQNNPLAGALNEGLRPETFRLLQTALAQTESEQVRLVQTQDTTQYQVPLMWRDNDTVKQDLLCLKRDDGQSTSEDNQKKQSRWQITLHFDLETLGPLDIELDLCPPAVSATFWSETTDTLSEIQQALRPLRETLTSLGADVGELRARHGRKLPGEQPVIRHSLVDIHT